MDKQEERDVERACGSKAFAAKLRRAAAAVEKGAPFTIQVAGLRLRVPADAELVVEHERAGDEEELEFQWRWRR